MARIRTIKPSFFESEDVAVLPLRARLLWIGLWTHCDDAGRTKDNARLVKARVWPLDPDVGLKDIEEDLEVLAEKGRIVRYEVDGQRYLQVTNWREHQKIQKPSPSKIPPPDSGSGTGGLPDDSGSAIPRKGREGERKGRDARETPPSPRCPQHVDNSNPPPCGACKESRIAREQWDLGAADRERESLMVVRRCRMCDADGYAFEPGTKHPKTPWEKCDHRPVRSVG